tara:strand:- start:31 stop:321 length:291 start_codon:yes stop_codon:yes gene_type:complete
MNTRTQQYAAQWVEEDHLPEDDLEYNPYFAVPGAAAFPLTPDGLKLAKQAVIDGSLRSGVEWGIVVVETWDEKRYCWDEDEDEKDSDPVWSLWEQA